MKSEFLICFFLRFSGEGASEGLMLCFCEIVMSGVPWELTELPRQLYSDPNGAIFTPPPRQRPRKPKSQQALGPIPERPGPADASSSSSTAAMKASSSHVSSPLAGGSSQKQRMPMYRQDAATSTTDLDGLGLAHDGGSADGSFDSPKKVVQKGQINALAKMLSALRR